MCHQVAPDQVLFGYGITRQACVLDRAERQENLAAHRDVNWSLDATTLCPNASDRAAAALQARDVGIVDQHQPLDRVVAAGFSLRETGGLEQKLYAIELIDRKCASARWRR